MPDRRGGAGVGGKREKERGGRGTHTGPKAYKKQY